MKISCAIIDDEPLAVNLLESYAKKTPFLDVKGKYSSALEAADKLRDNRVDLLFLDIQMPELNGLEFSEMVDKHTRIVFTTAFSQYAIDGYKLNAIDYLLKPISYSDFLRACNKALEWFEMANGGDNNQSESSNSSDSIFVKSDYKLVRIKFDDIIYIEGLKDYVKFYVSTSPKPILSLASMRAIEEHLPASSFLRIHRSYIVNMDMVDSIEKGKIKLSSNSRHAELSSNGVLARDGKDDKYLPVSDGYKDNIQKYVEERMINGKK